jgi:hypothetical protein
MKNLKGYYMFKLALLFGALIFSQFSFASICFEQAGNVTFLPKELCFEAMLLDVKNETLIIRDDKKVLPRTMPVSSAYHPAEEFPFTAKQNLFNKFAYCTEGLRADLTIDGTADAYGGVYPETMVMKVDYEYSWDICHSSNWETGSATYYFKHF